MGVQQVVRRACGRVVRAIAPPAPHVSHGRPSYSQQGEDMVIDCLLRGKRDGFYVDVGAHHPWRLSNTFFFYSRGWRGINIEASPDAVALFQAHRPRDVNLNLAIAAGHRTLTYHRFDEPAVNTFSPELVEAYRVTARYKLLATHGVRAAPLRDVLAEHLPAGQPIDFLSVDVEGLDAEVIGSNDWDRYRPTLVLVEDGRANSLDEVVASDMAAALRGCGYVPFSKFVHSQLYVDRARLHVDGDHQLRVLDAAP